jgi:methylated-DNA-[protein]-cysteine S-methyltransferase
MVKKHDKEFEALESALIARRTADASAWTRARRNLVERAAREELIDVAFERHDTPLGSIVLGATADGLVRIGLPAEREDEVLDELARLISPRVLRAERDSLTRTRRQLDEYFTGRRKRFDVPLDWRLTRGFRRDVLRATSEIPYGRTLTYREIATNAGHPAAVRAAGTALAQNPLPIVVPCHRVIPSTGGLGNYRGGAETKERLLRLESGA